MGYNLTAEQREICERGATPEEVDQWIEDAWQLGGDALVLEKIAIHTELPPVPYDEARRRNYASWGDQLDMQYHDGKDGTTTWVDHVRSVKAAHPKPE
jgi:hypothetical protein